jgi:RNA polymerase sigma factor (sigma-70 family)
MTPMLYDDQLSSSAFTIELPRLVGLCAHLTGDRGVAEDLAQDTLAEAWRQRHRLQDATAGPRWLSAIARNVCLRWQRVRGREIARQATYSDVDLLDNRRDALDLERDLERAELAALLDRALARLPPLTRAALIGRYMVGMPLAARRPYAARDA